MSHPAHPGPGAPHGDGTPVGTGRPSRPLSYDRDDPAVKPPIRYNRTFEDATGPPLDPERLALGRSKVTHALATATRELSSPEMCDVLAGFRPYQRHQILESLQDEGKLAIRLTCITRPVQFLAYYRLGSRSLSIATTIEPEGGAS